MRDATVLQDLVLQDPDGAPVRLGDSWQARPVLLAFIRHFG